MGALFLAVNTSHLPTYLLCRGIRLQIVIALPLPLLSSEAKQQKGRKVEMIIQSSTLLTMPILTSSETLRLSSSSGPVRFSPAKAFAASKTASFAGFFHHRVSDSISMSFSRSIPWISSPTVPSPRLLASISSSAAFSGSGGGGRDGLPGGSGGGGGDGGSSGRLAETGPFVGETEEDPTLGPDLIFLSVGGMTCGGCAASVKRILESQPQVASATVYLEKEIAVVWTVPEAKDTENWQQQLGEKLAKHLTTCGFKSEFQGQGEAIEKDL